MKTERAAGDSLPAAHRDAETEGVAHRIARDLASLDPAGRAYRSRLAEIDAIAAAEIQATTIMSARWMDSATVASSRRDLARDVQRLREHAATVASISRSSQAEQAENAIAELLGRMHEAEQQLAMRNAALGQDGLALSVEIEALRRYSQLTGRVAELLETQGGADQTEALMHLRQRQAEILAHLETALAGQTAIALLKLRNRELSKAIDAASKAALANLRVTAERSSRKSGDGDARSALKGVIEALDRWMAVESQPS